MTAQYISIWDSGETTIISDCRIDSQTNRITSFSKERTIISPYPEDAVDDMVEVLDEEYVLLGRDEKRHVFKGDDGRYYVGRA